MRETGSSLPRASGTEAPPLAYQPVTAGNGRLRGPMPGVGRNYSSPPMWALDAASSPDVVSLVPLPTPPGLWLTVLLGAAGTWLSGQWVALLCSLGVTAMTGLVVYGLDRWNRSGGPWLVYHRRAQTLDVPRSRVTGVAARDAVLQVVLVRGASNLVTDLNLVVRPPGGTATRYPLVGGQDVTGRFFTRESTIDRLARELSDHTGMPVEREEDLSRPALF